MSKANLAAFLFFLTTLSAQNPGVVVSRASNDGSGLEPGDVLSEWSQGESHGRLTTPLDLLYLEIEYNPRAPVELAGMRSGFKRTWIVPANHWGIEAQSNVGPETQQSVDRSLELARSGKHGEAAQTLASLAESSSLDEHQRAWLFYQTGLEYWQARATDRAVDAYRRAAALLADRPELKAMVLRLLGESLSRRNQLDEAEHATRQAIDSAREAASDSIMEAMAYYALAVISNQQRRNPEQLQALQRAEAIVRKWAPNSLTEATVLNGFGVAEKNRGNLDQAESHLRRAIELRQHLEPESVGLGALYSNLSNVLTQRGDLKQAEDLAQSAVYLQSRLAPSSMSLASSLTQLASIMRRRGRLTDAERNQTQALELAEKWGDQIMIASSYLNLGNITRAKRDPVRAQSYYERALSFSEKIPQASGFLSAILTGLGNLAHDRGDLPGAQEYHTRALALRENLVPPSAIDLATTYTNLASVAKDGNQLDRAETFASKAFERFQSISPNSLNSAAALYQLGDISILRGQYLQAEQLLGRARTIHESLSPGSLAHAETLERLSAAARLGKRTAEAVSLLRKAIGTLETQAPYVGISETSRSGFRASHIQWYRDLASMLVDQHQSEQAFEVIERARGRSMLNLIAERDLIYSGVIPAEIDQARRRNFAAFEELQSRLKVLNPETAKDIVAELTKRRMELERERDDLREQIVARSPRLAGLQYPQPLSAADTCRALDVGTALITYSVSESRVDAFVVVNGRPGCIAAVKLALSRNQLEGAIVRLRDSIVQQSDSDASERELYRLLIEPVQSQIGDATRLLISPDGPLHTLPWAALRRPSGEYLVQWKPLHFVLSATLYAQLRNERRARAYATDLIAFGDPAYEPVQRTQEQEIQTNRGTMFWPLPYSRKEVEGIAKLFAQKNELYLGEGATESRAKSAKEARYLHFAAHGLLDPNQPLNSSIILVRDKDGKNDNNGLLQAWEIIEQVRWNCDLVVLSACESALGTELEGEGLIGLTRAVQFAGARSVVASLWSADDRRTSDLMLSFYKFIKAGQGKDQALRSAQLAALGSADTAHPYYWAGVILNGDCQ